MDYKAGQIVHYKGIFNKIYEVEIVKIKEVKKFEITGGYYCFGYDMLVRLRKNGKLKIVNEKYIF